MGNSSSYQKVLAPDTKEVFNTFFSRWSPNVTHEKLWDIFRLAVNGGLEKENCISVEDVALLFDQLTDLVTAAHALHIADLNEPNKQEGTSND